MKCYLSHSVVHPCSHFHAATTPCSHFHAAATPCSHFHAAISMQHPLPAAARRHDRHQHDHQHRRPTQCSPRCTRAALSAAKQKKHEKIGGTYFWLVPLLVTICLAVVSSLFFWQSHYFFSSLHYFVGSLTILLAVVSVSIFWESHYVFGSLTNFVAASLFV